MELLCQEHFLLFILSFENFFVSSQFFHPVTMDLLFYTKQLNCSFQVFFFILIYPPIIHQDI